MKIVLIAALLMGMVVSVWSLGNKRSLSQVEHDIAFQEGRAAGIAEVKNGPFRVAVEAFNDMKKVNEENYKNLNICIEALNRK